MWNVCNILSRRRNRHSVWILHTILFLVYVISNYLSDTCGKRQSYEFNSIYTHSSEKVLAERSCCAVALQPVSEAAASSSSPCFSLRSRVFSLLFFTEAAVWGGRGAQRNLRILDPVTPELGQDHLRVRSSLFQHLKKRQEDGTDDDNESVEMKSI